MSLIITNTTTQVSGSTVDTELFQDPEDKTLKFLQPFQSRQAIDLEFDTETDILNFLDKHFKPGKDKVTVITGNEIWYFETLEDRNLMYFGTIRDTANL